MPSRINAFAMAIQTGLTVYDLEESELAYAPPFGSAKDPVNFAGMVAVDILRDDMPICHWDAVDHGFLLDVRQPAELAVEHVPGAVNIPLPELRARLAELPRNREILVFAVPASAPTTQRASCCRTGSRPETLSEACCRVRILRRFQPQVHEDNYGKRRSAVLKTR